MDPFTQTRKYRGDQLELIYNNSVWAQDRTWKTYLKRWMIETDGERERVREYVLVAWHDGDDILLAIINNIFQIYIINDFTESLMRILFFDEYCCF